MRLNPFRKTKEIEILEEENKSLNSDNDIRTPDVVIMRPQTGADVIRVMGLDTTGRFWDGDPINQPQKDDQESVTVTRTLLTNKEKEYIEKSIFIELENEYCSSRQNLVESITNSIEAISGNQRNKETIKYHIYESTERHKAGNTPFRKIFNVGYTLSFRQRMVLEATRLGKKETELRFGIPSSTLYGWIHSKKGMKTTTKTPTQSIKSPNAPINSIVSHKEDLENIVSALGKLEEENSTTKERAIDRLTESITARRDMNNDFVETQNSLRQIIETCEKTQRWFNTLLDNISELIGPDQYKSKVDLDKQENLKIRTASGKISHKKAKINEQFQGIIKGIGKLR